MVDTLLALPPWVVVALAVVLFATLACGGHFVVRRAYPAIDFSAHNEVGGFSLSVVGGLFAVTVAFIVGIVWNEFDDTAQRVGLEVSAAQNVWYTSAGLPQPLRGELRATLTTYAAAMVREEWPAMRSGGSSPRVTALLARLYAAAVRLRPADAGAANAQAAVLRHMAELHDERNRRLDDNASGISGFEWKILGIGAIVVVGFLYLIGLPNFRVQLVMTGLVAATIASLFTLIFELDYPFRGDLAIPSTAWAGFDAGLDGARYRSGSSARSASEN